MSTQTVDEIATTQVVLETPAISFADRVNELTRAIPNRKEVSGKIGYYVKGVSCKKFGLEHKYEKVEGKRWSKCHMCNSTRTNRPAKTEPVADTMTGFAAEVSA
jgi:predicted Zn-ribbon and HTH transcriptional regulator